MADLPEDINICYLAGEFLAAVIDGYDAGTRPDGVVFAGLNVKVRALPKDLPVAHRASNKEIILADIDTTTDIDGKITDGQGNPWIAFVAPSASLTPKGSAPGEPWKVTVTVSGTTGFSFPQRSKTFIPLPSTPEEPLQWTDIIEVAPSTPAELEALQALLVEVSAARAGAEDARDDAETARDIAVTKAEEAESFGGTNNEQVAGMLTAEGPSLAALRSAISKPRGEFDITRYGNAREAVLITDASMTSGSTVLSSTSRPFTSNDVGKKIGVRGAGPVSTDYAVLANDGVLVSTIVSVSGGVATLGAAATNSVTGARAVFGFPIDAAFMAASAAADAAGGGTIFIPAGRWLVSETLNYNASNVTVAGAGRSRSRVYYVHTGIGSSNGETPCFRGLGPLMTAGGKSEANFRDFLVDGQFFVATGAWGSEMKLIQVTDTIDSYVRDMAIMYCPATGIGYDFSVRCTLERNTLIQPGRLASIFNSGASAAGSGLGIAVGSSTVNVSASFVIRDNFISGPYNNTVGGGRTGIHLEGVYGEAEMPGGAHVVSGNIIDGFSIGIRDSGALGSVISNNQVSGCQYGIFLGTKGSTTSRLPRDTIVIGNVVRDSVNRFEPAGTSYGIVVSSQTTTDTTGQQQGRILVVANRVSNIRGHGIYIRGNPFPINNLRVADNSISDCLDSGINIEYEVNGLSIVDNGISGCGRRGGVYLNAIRVAANVVWNGGRLEGNDFTDYAAIPTQTNTADVHSSATLTGVRRFGNTGDPAEGVGPALSTIKNSTTTINNNSTLATVSSYSLTLLASTKYQFEALIEYSSDAAAGVKIQWALPSGANLSWTVDGVGVPDVGVLVLTSQAVLAGNGVGVLRVVRVSGLIRMGTTAGALTLTAAQSTATASNTVITTRSVMSVVKV